MTIRKHKEGSGKFDVISVNDEVRSFDFPTSDDYYIEGVVREINEHYYLIDATKRIAGNEEVDLESKTFEVTVCKNGSHGFFGITNGVELIKN